VAEPYCRRSSALAAVAAGYKRQVELQQKAGHDLATARQLVVDWWTGPASVGKPSSSRSTAGWHSAARLGCYSCLLTSLPNSSDHGPLDKHITAAHSHWFIPTSTLPTGIHHSLYSEHLEQGFLSLKF
jgi:hypothetical protein